MIFQNVSALVVLLVCATVESAHASIHFWGWNGFQSRSKRAAVEDRQAGVDVTGHSVVENWQTVCEHLCR